MQNFLICYLCNNIKNKIYQYLYIMTLNPLWDILSGILRNHSVSTPLEFVLHTNTKRSMLGYKISAIRHAKLYNLTEFKMH